jgi:hypothetical protein
MPDVKANLKKIPYCINFHSEGGNHDKNSSLNFVEHQEQDGQRQLCQIHVSLLLKDTVYKHAPTYNSKQTQILHLHKRKMTLLK